MFMYHKIGKSAISEEAIISNKKKTTQEIIYSLSLLCSPHI